MSDCKKVKKVVKEMELLAQSLGVDTDHLKNTHAEIWGECWDCGVALTDSKIHSNPTCPACGWEWDMS
jgi:predicted Zn-ribbon and HTH transcriptional regulator